MHATKLYKRLLFSLALFFSVFVLGAMGFWSIGQLFARELGEFDPTGDYQFTLLNSFYMAAITVSTVGYGEVTNFHAYLTDTGEDVATVYTLCFCIVSYLVVIYASANIVAALVEGAVGKAWYARKMKKLLESLNGHYIVCGAGNTGHHIVEELRKVGEAVVVVDGSVEALAEWEGSLEVISINGDATDDLVLKSAGLPRARGVFAALHDDKDNLFVVLTARQANPKARIIGRAAHSVNVGKLKSVGADAVISPNQIGGLRMASEMVRPSVVTFLDAMLRATDASLRFNEVAITEQDAVAGRTLAEFGVAAATGLAVVGVFRKDRTIVYNPQPRTVVNAGDALIVICSADQLRELKAHIQGLTIPDPNGATAKPDRKGKSLLFRRGKRKSEEAGKPKEQHRYEHLPKELIRDNAKKAPTTGAAKAERARLHAESAAVAEKARVEAELAGKHDAVNEAVNAALAKAGGELVAFDEAARRRRELELRQMFDELIEEGPEPPPSAVPASEPTVDESAAKPN